MTLTILEVDNFEFCSPFSKGYAGLLYFDLLTYTFILVTGDYISSIFFPLFATMGSSFDSVNFIETCSSG